MIMEVEVDNKFEVASRSSGVEGLVLQVLGETLRAHPGGSEVEWTLIRHEFCELGVELILI